jgi:hypothetical protein
MPRRKKSETRGYVVVASKERFFYLSALNLMHSIRDFDPDANIFFYTEERFYDSGADVVADKIEFCGDHAREKILGMAKSPWDKTFYIDADCEVAHEDLPTVFDKFDGNDVLFTYLPDERSYCYAELYFPGGRFEWCGGTCLYDSSKPLVKEFMHDWFELTKAQYNGLWWPKNEKGEEDVETYPITLKRWDQFSLWWLLNKDPKYCDGKLKVGRLDGMEDARWNYFSGYKYRHCEADPVIMHFSNTSAKHSWRNYEKNTVK